MSFSLLTRVARAPFPVAFSSCTASRAIPALRCMFSTQTLGHGKLISETATRPSPIRVSTFTSFSPIKLKAEDQQKVDEAEGSFDLPNLPPAQLVALFLAVRAAGAHPEQEEHLVESMASEAGGMDNIDPIIYLKHAYKHLTTLGMFLSNHPDAAKLFDEGELPQEHPTSEHRQQILEIALSFDRWMRRHPSLGPEFSEGLRVMERTRQLIEMHQRNEAPPGIAVDDIMSEIFWTISEVREPLEAAIPDAAALFPTPDDLLPRHLKTDD